MNFATRDALEDSIRFWRRLATGMAWSYESPLLPHGLCHRFKDPENENFCQLGADPGEICPLHNLMLEKLDDEFMIGNCDFEEMHQVYDAWNNYEKDPRTFMLAARKIHELLLKCRPDAEEAQKGDES
jgi:hypothetical protein